MLVGDGGQRRRCSSARSLWWIACNPVRSDARYQLLPFTPTTAATERLRVGFFAVPDLGEGDDVIDFQDARRGRIELLAGDDPSGLACMASSAAPLWRACWVRGPIASGEFNAKVRCRSFRIDLIRKNRDKRLIRFSSWRQTKTLARLRDDLQP